MEGSKIFLIVAHGLTEDFLAALSRKCIRPSSRIVYPSLPILTVQVLSEWRYHFAPEEHESCPSVFISWVITSAGSTATRFY